MPEADDPTTDADDLGAPTTRARLVRLAALARRTAPPLRRGRPLPGRGLEPGGRRDYAPGDDVRLVDWPAFARLDRLLVRVTEALPDPRLDVLVDASPSTSCGRPSPRTRAALAAASLAAVATGRDVATTLWWVGEPEGHTVVRRPGELWRALAFLASRLNSGAASEAPGPDDRAAAVARGPIAPTRLEATAARLVGGGPRGAVVVVTDGLDPGVLPAATRLRTLGRDVLVLAPNPDQEFAPAAAAAALEAGEVVWVDAESGARQPGAYGPGTHAAVAAARAARLDALATALGAVGVPLERLGPRAPFEDAARSMLQARGR